MLFVWVLSALLALAVVVTYSRLPPEELYHVSRSGLEGGLSRVLVLLNYPIALGALGVVAVLLERGAPRVLAAVAIALCAVTAVPGVVDQSDLDARAINFVPALGVAIAAALTVRARPRLGIAPRQPLDPLRGAIAVAIVLISIPWFFAELGFYAPDPILADEPSPDEPIAAVHLGTHHGTAGALLALAGLALSRVARTRASLALLALMIAYGIGNAAQDFWFEQVVKRGTTDVGLPSMVVPRPTLAWGVLLLAAAAVYAVLVRELSDAERAGGSRARVAGSPAAADRP